MILRQLLHSDPVGISYVIGCAGKQACAVVDPADEPERYLTMARDMGMRIRYVIDTHVHADHLSTGRALAELARADYVLHETAGVTFNARMVADGDSLEIGNVRLDVMHLPGHTPEHLGLLVTDRTRAADPWCMITGHTLMVGDMGRTELASTAEDGAKALFESAERLRALPDHVVVLPGAYAGSMCGRALSGTPTSTIGFERRFNKAFGLSDRSAFIAAMLRDIPPAPPNAARMRATNLGLSPK